MVRARQRSNGKGAASVLQIGGSQTDLTTLKGATLRQTTTTRPLYGKKLDNRDIVTTGIAITGCDETAGAADLVSLTHREPSQEIGKTQVDACLG